MLSGRTTLQAGACAGAPPRLNRAQKPRIARQTRHRCSAAAQPVDGGASSVAAAAASCPYSAAKAALQQFLPQQQVQQQQQWQQQQWGAAGAEGFVQTPGPHPLSVESVAMVTTIFTEGLHEAILRGALRYGPVSRYANPAALGGAAGWVFLNSPQDIQYVNATNTRNFAERFLPDIYKWVTHEKGILGSSGEYNRRHRKLVGPPFRSAALLSRFADVVVNRSARVAETFASQPGSFRTNVAVQTQRLTLDIVGLTAFSHDFGECDAIARDISGSAPPSASDQDRLLWAVNAFGQVLSEVFITPMPLLRLMDALGFRQLQKLREACEVMRHSMLGVIAERRGALEARAAAGAGAGEARDVLDMLLQATDDNGVPMTDSELWEDVHDIMGAGHETTATTTAAALYCIAAHPEVEARVVQELEAVLGGRLPTMADLDSMPYLSAVVKEVLRLYPAIPVFPRQAAAEDRLPSGHRVRKGDVVFMSTYALHRDPAVWEDPLRFDPERFLGARGEALHRFQWLPFGAGPRVCLGASFATMSVSLMVATLLQRCKFTPVRPTAQLIPAAYDITLNFDRTGGLLMEVEPRRRAHGIPSGLAAEQPVHA